MGAIFLDRRFRAPTCPDLESTFGDVSHCEFREETIYQGKTPVAMLTHDAKIVYQGSRLSHQTILERTPFPFRSSSRGEIKVRNAIGFIDGAWRALAPLPDGTWEVRREMTYPPAQRIQDFLRR
jgi:hypothetical protein